MQLEFAIKPGAPDFLQGEPLFVGFSVKNLGEAPVELPGDRHLGWFMVFEVSSDALEQPLVGASGPTPRPDWKALPQASLAPGESLSSGVLLEQLVEIPGPGTYQVTATLGLGTDTLVAGPVGFRLERLSIGAVALGSWRGEVPVLNVLGVHAGAETARLVSQRVLFRKHRLKRNTLQRRARVAEREPQVFGQAANGNPQSDFTEWSFWCSGGTLCCLSSLDEEPRQLALPEGCERCATPALKGPERTEVFLHLPGGLQVVHVPPAPGDDQPTLAEPIPFDTELACAAVALDPPEGLERRSLLGIAVDGQDLVLDLRILSGPDEEWEAEPDAEGPAENPRRFGVYRLPGLGLLEDAPPVLFAARDGRLRSCLLTRPQGDGAAPELCCVAELLFDPARQPCLRLASFARLRAPAALIGGRAGYLDLEEGARLRVVLYTEDGCALVPDGKGGLQPLLEGLPPDAPKGLALLGEHAFVFEPDPVQGLGLHELPRG